MWRWEICTIILRELYLQAAITLSAYEYITETVGNNPNNFIPGMPYGPRVTSVQLYRTV